MNELHVIERLEAWMRAALPLDNAAIAAGDALLVALPENVKIADLEAFGPGRRRFRGTFQTESVIAFANYVGMALPADLVHGVPCFIEPESHQVCLILDIGTVANPGHCDHRAMLKPKRSALYAAVLEVNGRGKSQRELIDFLQDWLGSFECFEDHACTSSIPVSAAIAAIRRIDINTAATTGSEVAALSESRSSFSKVEASSCLAVPIALVFTLRPFPELAMRRVVVDLGVSPGEKVPALKLRIRELEALQESVATEFGEVVRSALAQLPDSVAVVPFTGAFKW